MAQKVIIKQWRGLRENLPMAAPGGVFMWCTDTGQLWVGTDDNRMLIAGPVDETPELESELVNSNGEYVLTAAGEGLAFQGAYQ